jgi:hypothetical protein
MEVASGARASLASSSWSWSIKDIAFGVRATPVEAPEAPFSAAAGSTSIPVSSYSASGIHSTSAAP